MKTYKIDISKISDYTKRNDNKVFKTLLFTMLTLPIFMFLLSKQKNAPDNFTYILILPMLFSTLIVVLIYLNNKKLTRLSAENLQILVDENSITRVIDLDKEPRLNIIHKLTYAKAKDAYGSYYAKVEFKDIKSIEKNNGDLWVKSTNSNSFNGKNIVIVPKELSNFDDLEMELNNKLN